MKNTDEEKFHSANTPDIIKNNIIKNNMSGQEKQRLDKRRDLNENGKHHLALHHTKDVLLFVTWVKPEDQILIEIEICHLLK